MKNLLDAVYDVCIKHPFGRRGAALYAYQLMNIVAEFAKYSDVKVETPEKREYMRAVDRLRRDDITVTREDDTHATFTDGTTTIAYDNGRWELRA